MKAIETFNNTNSELKKNGYIAEISDHCRNYITIYWRQSNVK